MSTGYGLLALALACMVWNIVTNVRIFADLRSRGAKLSLFWWRLMFPAYAHRYRKITEQETGRAGPLFYQWIISINAALVATIAGLIALRC